MSITKAKGSANEYLDKDWKEIIGDNLPSCNIHVNMPHGTNKIKLYWPCPSYLDTWHKDDIKGTWDFPTVIDNMDHQRACKGER